MSSNTSNIEVIIPAEVAAKTFGSDTRPAIEAYERAVAEAENTRSSARNAINSNLRTASAAVRDVLGAYDERAEAIVNLLSTLTEADRNKQREAVETTYSLAIESAQKAKSAAIDADPFAKFVVGYLTRRYGRSYGDIFNSAMPLTYEGMRELAHTHGWCSDYETVMRVAVRDGALPKEDVTILRKPVEVDNVPHSYGAQEGEKWVRVVTIPAYVRFNDSNGRMRQPDALLGHALSDVYEKVEIEDAPSES